MMRYSSPFGISTQMNKTMIRLPIHAPSKSQDVWISSSKKKTTQNSVLSQSSKLLESKLSITNLTVDSSTFGSHDHKPEKKEKKEMNNKLKVAWHIKRRQSIIKREECKRKANLNRCFSLKSKQATIHSIHPPQEVRFSVNSWNQTFIDRTIQNLTVELKQLFNLRHFKKKEKLKTEQDKDQKANLGKTAYATNKSRDNLPKARYTRNDFMPNKHEISKKEIKKDDWLPWNEYSKARNLKQNERDVVAEWYDRNFSISLS